MKITIEFNSVEEYLKLKDAQEKKSQEKLLKKAFWDRPVTKEEFQKRRNKKESANK